MKNRRKDLVGGVILLVIGVVALLNQFVEFNWGNLGLLFLPALGGLFLVWGILTREGGLIIPGGIISGIGWGAYAIAGPFQMWQGDNEGGVFLIIFGLGFGLITLLTAVFTDETHWWALIPGGIIAFVGVAVLFGGVLLTALELVGTWWPLILIALGIYVLWQGSKNKDEKLLDEKM